MPATTASLKDLYRSMVLIREAEETLLRGCLAVRSRSG